MIYYGQYGMRLVPRINKKAGLVHSEAGEDMDTKYVCVIVDDFTGRALGYPNVHLYDYGQNLSVAEVNFYSYDYYTGTRLW